MFRVAGSGLDHVAVDHLGQVIRLVVVGAAVVVGAWGAGGEGERTAGGVDGLVRHLSHDIRDEHLPRCVHGQLQGVLCSEACPVQRVLDGTQSHRRVELLVLCQRDELGHQRISGGQEPSASSGHGLRSSTAVMEADGSTLDRPALTRLSFPVGR